MSNLKFVIVALTLAFALVISTSAGAQEPGMLNEIAAQINNDIITRSQYLESLEAFKEDLKAQMQGKSDAEVNAEFDRLKAGVLDSMIDDLLLQQRAKELGLDVEAEVNQQMLQIAKDSGLRDVRELEQAMRNQGLDPDKARDTLRKRFQQQNVVQLEVIQPLLSRGESREQLAEARKTYLKTLREAAFIQIAKG